MTKRTSTSRVAEGSGNVFRDLGFKQLGLTQAEAGEILGIRQPHVSALMRGRSAAFSVERLMQFLTALGQDVEIAVRPTRKRRGVLSR